MHLQSSKYFYSASQSLFLLALVWANLSLANHLSAQSIKPIVRTISVEDGLAHNYIYRIYQDNYGGMWFATANGLNYYDGKDILAFTHDPENENSLSQNDIGDLKSDGNGSLWMAMHKSVDRYDRRTESFTHYPLDYGGHYIYPDTSGGVWVATTGGIKYKAENEENFSTHQFKPHPIVKDLTTSVVRFIHLGRDGNLYFATQHGLYTINTMSKEEKWILPCSEVLENGSKILHSRAIAEDDQGNIFIGAYEGLYKFSPGDTCLKAVWTKESPHWNGETVKIEELAWGNSVLYVSTYGYGLYEIKVDEEISKFQYRPINLGVGLVTKIEIDHSGIVWLGTVGYGVKIYDPKINNFDWIVPSEIPGVGLKDDHVYVVHEDSKKNLWLGTKKGVHAIRADSFSNAYVKNESLGGGEDLLDTYTISEREDGSFFIGTGGGLKILYPEQKFYENSFGSNPDDVGGITNNIVMADYQDSLGNYWAAFWGGGVANLTSESINHYNCQSQNKLRLYHCHMADIIGDRSGNIWIAIAYYGLHKLDPDANNLVHYQAESDKSDGLSHNYVRSLMEDRSGNIWIGTSGGGINKLDPETGKFLHYFDGFLDKLIIDIIEDKSGFIWILTNRDIIRMDPKTETYLKLGYGDGLPRTTFESAVYSEHSNKIRISSNAGIFSFDPDNIDIDRIAPKLAIRSINRFRNDNLDGKPLSLKGAQSLTEIELDHNDNLVSLDFSVLHYRNNESCNLSYYLEGLHKDWIDIGNKREISFSKLKQGRYKLLVKVSNANGVWIDKPLELSILVKPPWWKSIWAYLAYLLGAILILYYFRKYELGRIELSNELKNKEKEAEKMRELDLAKSRLFANISHEFRTPLTVILGQSERIVEPNGIKEVILRNSRKLLRLINQILDLAKMESGKLELSYVHGNIITYLRYITESLSSLAESQNIQLVFYQEVEEVKMDFDEDKIQGILSNLLSNAIKFTPPGGRILVHVNQLKIEENEQLVIKVKDNGIGIAEDRLDHVFDRFYQIDNSMVRKNEGTGIGLAYVRDLINLMNGRIDVKSKLGQETEFIISLPISNSAVLKAPSGRINPEILEIDQFKTIENIMTSTNAGEKGEDLPLALIVDDSADVRNYIASCLANNYTVLSASNGEMGLNKAKEFIPDIIISDVMMPEMDGYEFCNHIKQDERTSHIPLILLTAKVGTSAKITGFEKGADAYLEKPFDRKELLVRIKQLLELRKELQKRFSSIKEFSNPKENKEIAFLQKVQEILHEHLSDTDFSVMQLCQKVRLSQSQLYRKIKALTGKSIASYIRSYRLKHAKTILQSDSKNVSEVAYEVGFSDPSYFSRSFLDEFGFPPSELRK